MPASEPEEIRLLSALERGERAAFLQVTKVITGFLSRYGAYDLREHWDDLIQEVLVGLLRAQKRGVIRDERALINYTGSITRNSTLR